MSTTKTEPNEPADAIPDGTDDDVAGRTPNARVFVIRDGVVTPISTATGGRVSRRPVALQPECLLIRSGMSE